MAVDRVVALCGWVDDSPKRGKWESSTWIIFWGPTERSAYQRPKLSCEAHQIALAS